jgi:hypothetical protein
LGKKVVKKKENIHHINILKTAANEQIDTFEMNSSQNVLTLLHH